MSDDSPPLHIELAQTAARDLRRLRRHPALRDVLAALHGLSRNPWPSNLDVRPLRGLAPWMRLRHGDFRIVFRALSMEELSERTEQTGVIGFIVARIIDRQDLELALRTLQ